MASEGAWPPVALRFSGWFTITNRAAGRTLNMRWSLHTHEIHHMDQLTHTYTGRNRYHIRLFKRFNLFILINAVYRNSWLICLPTEPLKPLMGNTLQL